MINSTPKYVNNPLNVILHCLVCILPFNVNNGDAAKSVLPHCGS